MLRLRLPWHQSELNIFLRNVFFCSELLEYSAVEAKTSREFRDIWQASNGAIRDFNLRKYVVFCSFKATAATYAF